MNYLFVSISFHFFPFLSISSSFSMGICVEHASLGLAQDCIESTERPYPRLRGPVTLTQEGACAAVCSTIGRIKCRILNSVD